MKPPVELSQRVVQLAPLAEVFAALDACVPMVAARSIEVPAATGCVLAGDITFQSVFPPTPVADRDGWAVRADLFSDAGSYTPVPLPEQVPWVEHGELLPPACDAVLTPDAVALVVGSDAREVVAPPVPGEGVRMRAFDAAAGTLLRRHGTRLRAADIAVLQALGFVHVSVRVPHIAVVATHRHATATASFLASVILQAGATVELATSDYDTLAGTLDTLRADAIVTIGGTGQGRADRSVQTVAAMGRLLLHGMGIRPGETGGLGVVGRRPVLLLPGALQAALAVWLVVGREMIERLAGELAEPGALHALTLGRKITSTVGLAEVVLVRRSEGGAEPLAAGAFPLQAIAQADGWVLVPPESEGYPIGSSVAVKPLP